VRLWSRDLRRVQVDNFAAATDASLREETYRQPFLPLGGIIRGAAHAGGNGRGNEGKWSEIKIRKKSPFNRTKSERERERGNKSWQNPEWKTWRFNAQYKRIEKKKERKTETFPRSISRFLQLARTDHSFFHRLSECANGQIRLLSLARDAFFVALSLIIGTFLG